MGGPKMKRAILFLLAVGIAASPMAPQEAEAGLLDKLKGGSDKESDQEMTPRYDNYPSLDFHLGTLTRTGWNDWRLDELDVQFASDCVIESNGEGVGVLTEGQQAIITGSQVGNTIVALRVTILSPNWDMGPKNNDEDVIWSESDPTVGVGRGPS